MTDLDRHLHDWDLGGVRFTFGILNQQTGILKVYVPSENKVYDYRNGELINEWETQ